MLDPYLKTEGFGVVGKGPEPRRSSGLPMTPYLRFWVTRVSGRESFGVVGTDVEVGPACSEV